MKIVPSSVMQAWERRTFASGITVGELMSRAVQGCLKQIQKNFPRPGQALFLCGKGHNGNDGLWLAALLEEAGWKVQILLSDPPADRKKVAVDAVIGMESRALVWPLQPPLPAEPVLVLDCLLGLGTQGPLRGPALEILQWWSLQKKSWHSTLSLDCPSGLDPDTGAAHDFAFQADRTLAIGTIKQGCLRQAGPRLTGRILPVEIGFAEDSAGEMPDFFDLVEAQKMAPGLSVQTHKYQRGAVAIFAGSPGFAGAALLSSRAALRSGAGVVRLFCHPECRDELALATPEVMTMGWAGGAVPETALAVNSWLIGPGFGTSAEAAGKLRRLLAAAKGTVVLDADALTLLGREPGLLESCAAESILTPHEGEFKRLSGREICERTAAVAAWTALHPRSVLLLKGPNTLVRQGRGLESYNGSGHPGLATAGSGDVLAGIITALTAQGYDPLAAARLGAFWHGLAAELCLGERGEQTLIATDLIEKLGKAWNEIRPLG